MLDCKCIVVISLPVLKICRVGTTIYTGIGECVVQKFKITRSLNVLVHSVDADYKSGP